MIIIQLLKDTKYSANHQTIIDNSLDNYAIAKDFFSALDTGRGAVGSKLSRSDDADDDGRGRSERSERSPRRGKLPPQRSLAYKKKRPTLFSRPLSQIVISWSLV